MNDKAQVIAVVAGIMTLLVSIAGLMDETGLIEGIAHLIIAAVALMISDRFLPGLKVVGSGGALTAAVAIGAVYWLGGLALGLVISQRDAANTIQ